jgi:hypothetical protein
MDKLKSKLLGGQEVINTSREVVIEITNLAGKKASISGTKMRLLRLK